MKENTGLSAVIAVVTALVFSVTSSNGARPGPRDGFRGFQWGHEPDKAMIRTGYTGNLVVYEFPGELEEPGVLVPLGPKGICG